MWLKFCIAVLLLQAAVEAGKKKNKNKTNNEEVSTGTAAASSVAAAGGFAGGFAAGGFAGGFGGNGRGGGGGGPQGPNGLIPPFLFSGNLSREAVQEYFAILKSPDNVNLSRAQIDTLLDDWAANNSVEAELTEFRENVTTTLHTSQLNLLKNVTALPAALQKVFAIQNDTSLTLNQTITQVKAVFESLDNSTAKLLGIVLFSQHGGQGGPGGKGGKGGFGGGSGGFGGFGGGQGGGFGGFGGNQGGQGGGPFVIGGFGGGSEQTEPRSFGGFSGF